MKLRIQAGDTTHTLEVPDDVVRDGEEFFRKMDLDMDRGWQMSREFVENPDRIQRCQIAAHKLLGALTTGNHSMATLMAGYIVKRAPGVTGLDIDVTGEMGTTELLFDPETSAAPAPGTAAGPKPTKAQALEQAGKEVSKVYRVGKVYRYAVLDRASNQWIESPPLDDAKEAEAARLRAFKTRFDELTR